MFSKFFWLWNINIFFAGQALLAPKSEVQNTPRSEIELQASNSEVSDFEALHILDFSIRDDQLYFILITSISNKYNIYPEDTAADQDTAYGKLVPYWPVFILLYREKNLKPVNSSSHVTLDKVRG